MPFQHQGLSGSSNNPGLSLVRSPSEGFRFPDLAACVRAWHLGHKTRDPDGKEVRLPWVALEVVHLDHRVDVEIFEVFADDDDDQKIHEVEDRIHAYTEALKDPNAQHFLVTCHFRLGNQIAEARLPVTHSIRQLGVDGTGTYGRRAFSGSVAEMARPDTWVAQSLRDRNESQEMAWGIARDNVSSLMEQLREARATIAMYQTNEGKLREALNEAEDRTSSRKIAEKKAGVEVFAVEQVISRAGALLQIAGILVSKHLNKKLDGVKSPKEERHVTLVRDLLDHLQQNVAPDMASLEGMMTHALKLPKALQDRIVQAGKEAALEAMQDSSLQAAQEGLLSFSGADQDAVHAMIGPPTSAPTVQQVGEAVPEPAAKKSA